jgi:2-haloacid dehalogenase
MQGVWVDRSGAPWEPFAGDPDLVVEGLDELADAMGV